MKLSIEGVLAPVFTPMDEAGNINYSIIPEYMDELVTNQVKGILVGGTTGEAASLNVAERKQLLTAWITAARPRGVDVISQVGGAPLPDVIELAKFSEQVKASAIMTLPELYYKPRTVDQLVAYLEAVSAAAPSLPLIFYHFPMMSGVDLDMREFFQAAKTRIPNFKAMKADLGVALQVEDLLDSDQRIFIGNHHILEAALKGHDSSIATVTNLFPRQVQNIVQCVSNGDMAAATKHQEFLNVMVDSISKHGDFVPVMKAAMQIISGVRVGSPRLPLTRLNHTQIQIMNDEFNKRDLSFLLELLVTSKLRL